MNILLGLDPKNNNLRRKTIITLFEDKELEELTDMIYSKCAEKDCDKCKYRNSVKEDVCVIEVTMDLYRHWKSLICDLEDMKRR